MMGMPFGHDSSSRKYELLGYAEGFYKNGRRADEYNRLREAHPDLMHDDILKRMTTWGGGDLEILLKVRQRM